jgi:TolB-like protein/tetratricopeptide (TPR) repeat protein
MFTDMVGYTALGQRNEELSLALVEEQRKLIRIILIRHNGREIKTVGDSFLVEFANAVDAVRCAYDIQRAIREFNLSIESGRRIHLRIGIHVGEVVENLGDIEGDAVNVASRIEPLADDGGVCLSRQVYDHVQRKMDFHLSSLGPRNLKNVIEPLEVYKIVMPWDEKPETPRQLERKRIAILPFANMSQDPNDSYFADGITEEIISTVSGISGLRVISRTSIMHYKKTSKLLKEIGRELDVGSILEGSIRKAGSMIRITTQLIDVVSDEHLWTQSYNRELDDVFLVQTEIARQVADALRVRILPNEGDHLRKVPTSSPEAHSIYLNGLYFWNRRSEEDLKRALELFKAAVEIDPSYSSPNSGIANCYLVLGDHRYMPYLEAFSKAKEYALRAVDLDPDSGEAHASLAQAILYLDRDASAAEREYEKAIGLSPSYATTYHWYGITLVREGRLTEGLEKALRAQELDPLSPQITSFVGLVYLWLGKYDMAERQQSRALELHPGFIPAITNLRWTYLTEKKYSQAEVINSEYRNLTKDYLNTTTFLAAVYALAGRKDEAVRVMAEAEALPNPDNLHRYYKVVYYVGLGDYEKAIELAQVEYDAGADWLGEIEIDPILFPIRSDPRIRAILKRVSATGSPE